MAPWNQPRPCHPSWKEILQMERGKASNKSTEELMNQVKELLHESSEDQALTNEEVLEERAYEESFQEDPDEAYHVEDQEENTMSYDCFEDLDDSMFHDPGSEDALDTVNQHIDTFI
jgi:hypothetical protein